MYFTQVKSAIDPPGSDRNVKYGGVRMSLAYWRDDCKTNFPEVDQEHQELLVILEALYRAILLNQSTSSVQTELDHLFRCALIHCETEEALMTTYNYPDHSVHGEQHEELLSKIFNLRLKTEQSQETLTLDVVYELATWLGRHIWDYDLKLVQFIQQRQQDEALGSRLLCSNDCAPGA
jgi:hemerythrin